LLHFFSYKTLNYQSFDLGLDPMLSDDKGISKAVTDMSKDMDLVMLLEYFDESLILLKVYFWIRWLNAAIFMN